METSIGKKHGGTKESVALAPLHDGTCTVVDLAECVSFLFTKSWRKGDVRATRPTVTTENQKVHHASLSWDGGKDSPLRFPFFAATVEASSPRFDG